LGIDKTYYQEHLAGRGGDAYFGRIKKAIRAFHKYTPAVERFLDIGCDDGRITLGIMKAIGAKEVYGVDIYEPGCLSSIEKGIKCVRLNLDKDNLPFPDNYFNAIFWGENIEHLFDPDNVLEEVRRTLTNDGICVVSTPNLAAWHNRITLLLGYQPYFISASARHIVGRPFLKGAIHGDHVRGFTLKSLRELIYLHGMTILEVQGISNADGTDIPMHQPLKIADDSFSFFPSLAHGVQCVLRKNNVFDEL
jgi:SAM-dependent methyltransferase